MPIYILKVVVSYISVLQVTRVSLKIHLLLFELANQTVKLDSHVL